MSHKIKISFNEKKTVVKKDTDNQINKISINLGVNQEKEKSSSNYENLLDNQDRYDKKLKPNFKFLLFSFLNFKNEIVFFLTIS